MHLKFLGDYQVICCLKLDKIRSSSRQVMLCSQIGTLCGGLNYWLLNKHSIVTLAVIISLTSNKNVDQKYLLIFSMTEHVGLSTNIFHWSSLNRQDHHKNHYLMALYIIVNLKNRRVAEKSQCVPYSFMLLDWHNGAETICNVLLNSSSNLSRSLVQSYLKCSIFQTLDSRFPQIHSLIEI